MHGNKSQNARQRTLAAFRGTRTRVLVATDVAARGIDVDAITHVVNFDVPHEPETYVHRIGRTGRAGASGVAITFCDRSERKQLAEIEKLLRKAIPVDAQSEAPRDERRGERPAKLDEPRPRTRPADESRRPSHAPAHPAGKSKKKNFRPPWAGAGKAKAIKKRREMAALGA